MRRFSHIMRLLALSVVLMSAGVALAVEPSTTTDTAESKAGSQPVAAKPERHKTHHARHQAHHEPRAAHHERHKAHHEEQKAQEPAAAVAPAQAQ